MRIGCTKFLNLIGIGHSPAPLTKLSKPELVEWLSLSKEEESERKGPPGEFLKKLFVQGELCELITVDDLEKSLGKSRVFYNQEFKLENKWMTGTPDIIVDDKFVVECKAPYIPYPTPGETIEFYKGQVRENPSYYMKYWLQTAIYCYLMKNDAPYFYLVFYILAEYSCIRFERDPKVEELVEEFVSITLPEYLNTEDKTSLLRPKVIELRKKLEKECFNNCKYILFKEIQLINQRQ